jgi:hypothetical protein
MKREEYLNTVKFKGNGRVLCNVFINYRIFKENEEELKKVIEKCPNVNVGFEKDTSREKENKRRDNWGCLWHYPGDYLDGQVIEFPLENWDNFKDYKPPASKDYQDWNKLRRDVLELRKKGELVSLGVEHGFFFLRLTYLRRFENLMIDIAEGKKGLDTLIDIVTDYWCDVIKRFVELKPDIIHFGDDLGMQTSLPISPISWRKYIKPSYKKIFSIARENDIEVYLHTDGYIVDIIPDLIETGVTVLNPQDLVNGLDNIERLVKGKICIDLDIDRQNITFFGTPKDIEEHILNCIRKLGSPKGGLMLVFGAYPGIPIENLKAVILAMEKYNNYWCKK